MCKGRLSAGKHKTSQSLSFQEKVVQRLVFILLSESIWSSVCGANNFWFGNKGTQDVLMSLLSHRTTCDINTIDMHKTPRLHETDSTEPHVDNGYTNNSMILLHKNTIIINTKFAEEWNS